jgi:uncharacterized membrane protein
MLELPVDNKAQAYANSIAILLLISVVTLFVVYLKTEEVLSVLSIYGIIILLWLLVTIREVKKNDIRKVILVDGNLVIYHRSGIIEVPVSDVEQINVGINYFMDRQGMSNRYTLCLSHKYVFGNKINLKFNWEKGDPQAIVDVKKMMKGT